MRGEAAWLCEVAALLLDPDPVRVNSRWDLPTVSPRVIAWVVSNPTDI